MISLSFVLLFYYYLTKYYIDTVRFLLRHAPHSRTRKPRSTNECFALKFIGNAQAYNSTLLIKYRKLLTKSIKIFRLEFFGY